MVQQSGAGCVVIAGGSGFLGISVASALAKAGWEVVVLSRRTPVIGPWRHVAWDARTPGTWQQELNGAAGLVNLVGRTVDCIKTPDHIDEIVRSRVEATRVLGIAVRAVAKPPPVWVQMSTAHIYGDPPKVVCTEDSPYGYGLAPFVACAWEQAFVESVLSSQKPVVLRTSFVIGCDRGAGGGALARLKFLASWGLGGRVGTGNQGMSWLHEVDLQRLVERALSDDSMRGTYIASSPHPVSQYEFMRELRGALGVRIGLPATASMVKFGAHWLLRTDPDLALYGRYVVSQRLRDEQHVFAFPELRGALEDLLQA